MRVSQTLRLLGPSTLGPFDPSTHRPSCDTLIQAVLSWIRAMAKDGGSLIEGHDYYLEDGLFVLTAGYLLRRGYCCGNGCRHCPYDEPQQEPPSAASPKAPASRAEEEAL